jgi:hypothetical protein
MVGRARTCAAAAAAILLLGSAGPAHAAKWREVTPGQPVSALAAPGVTRSGDGVLHVLWARTEGLGGSVQHSAVAAPGNAVTGPNAVYAYNGGVNESVAVIGVAEGLRAFFSGLGDSLGDPRDDGVETALSTNGGTTWTPSPAIVSHDSHAYASGLGAALAPGNVPIFAWGDTGPGSAGFHVGLDAASVDVHFGSPTVCCEYDANVAVDGATGAAFVAWKFIYSDSGTAVQATSGGDMLQPPGGQAAETGIRTPVTGRLGAGDVFLGYQFGTNQFLSRPAVWNVTQRRLVDDGHLKGQRNAQAIGLAPGPAGKLWLFYARGDRLYATRSNDAATRFGAIVSVPKIAGKPQLLNLVGEGSAGPLDLVAVFRNDTGASLWQRRLLAGLTLKAKVNGDAVTLTVTDAGAKVGGAKVKLAGKTAVTGANGKVTLTVAPGRYKAKASKTGYKAAKLKVKVKPG